MTEQKLNLEQKSVFQANQANKEKAKFYYDSALKAEAKEDEFQQETKDEASLIMTNLQQALCYGSDEAAVKFLERTRQGKFGEFKFETALKEIKKSADQGNAAAAYCYGRYFAGHTYTKEPFPSTEAYSEQDREVTAIAYFDKGMQLNHEHCKSALFQAYKLGNIGCIRQNQKKWEEFCVQWINKNNYHSQSMALDFGAQLCGFYADGTLLAEKESKLIPGDVRKGLTYLYQATRGTNLNLAALALQRIVAGQTKGLGKLSKDLVGLKNKLLAEINQQNGFIALYFAWYSLPNSFQERFSDVFRFPRIEEMSLLIPEEEKTFDRAAYFLERVTSPNELQAIATSLRDLITLQTYHHQAGPCCIAAPAA